MNFTFPLPVLHCKPASGESDGTSPEITCLGVGIYQTNHTTLHKNSRKQPRHTHTQLTAASMEMCRPLTCSRTDAWPQLARVIGDEKKETHIGVYIFFWGLLIIIKAPLLTKEEHVSW